MNERRWRLTSLKDVEKGVSMMKKWMFWSPTINNWSGDFDRGCFFQKMAHATKDKRESLEFGERKKEGNAHHVSN